MHPFDRPREVLDRNDAPVIGKVADLEAARAVLFPRLEAPRMGLESDERQIARPDRAGEADGALIGGLGQILDAKAHGRPPRLERKLTPAAGRTERVRMA